MSLDADKDDGKVGYLVNADQKGNAQQQRSPSNNVRRIMLGIAVHNIPFLLYKVIEHQGGPPRRPWIRVPALGADHPLGFSHLSIYLHSHRRTNNRPTD
jgi:hypothetical protein